MNKALFLDRDGTLMIDPGYSGDPEAVELVPYILAGLKAFVRAGYLPIIVTNQSAIARGYFGADAVEAVNGRVAFLLAKHGVEILDAFYCPHHPDDGCACRKPKPGLLIEAAQKHRIDLAASVMIGDKLSDVDAGEAAGCATCVLLSDDPHAVAPIKAATLNEAASLVLARHVG